MFAAEPKAAVLLASRWDACTDCTVHGGLVVAGGGLMEGVVFVAASGLLEGVVFVGDSDPECIICCHLCTLSLAAS